MPELPEVEITRRNLRRWLAGGTVTRSFDRRLVGRRVVGVGRRGKWLRIELDGRLLFSHLGMTGKWLKRGTGEPRLRWERARLDVTDGMEAWSTRFVDLRRFGQLIVACEDIEAWTSLGPDPLLDGLDASGLARALGRRRRAIKEALMDQSIVAGIGNIMATEALWRARVDPRARTDALSGSQLRAVARAVTATIERSLKAGAKAEMEYVHDAGARNPFRIYRRAGQRCPRCGAVLLRVVIAGRGTAYCPSCQRPGATT
ncbi:MAG: bifunctional DNA-formamidopyrimidine glycosylase/DNA-(apurinic or apyrimidinic site) lyase [Myxococcota bacterium]|nr:bifunctional DNA-formamidopyrimidine glycosylase/DNA-(apurinic or apyrimidinic site) lyase [Myxococcota bacterium]